MRQLDLSKNAADFLETLAAKQYRQVVSAMLDLLGNHAPHDARPLKGYPDVLRVDVGEYRIVYRVTQTTVIVLLIGKRNDDEVYKLLKRKM
jgi:mRNA interferase RelE/StbE